MDSTHGEQAQRWLIDTAHYEAGETWLIGLACQPAVLKDFFEKRTTEMSKLEQWGVLSSDEAARHCACLTDTKRLLRRAQLSAQFHTWTLFAQRQGFHPWQGFYLQFIELRPWQGFHLLSTEPHPWSGVRGRPNFQESISLLVNTMWSIIIITIIIIINYHYHPFEISAKMVLENRFLFGQLWQVLTTLSLQQKSLQMGILCSHQHHEAEVPRLVKDMNVCITWIHPVLDQKNGSVIVLVPKQSISISKRHSNAGDELAKQVPNKLSSTSAADH